MSNFSRILTRDARSEQARERHLGPDPLNPSFTWVDLDEQLRGALRRMASVAEGMRPLPAGCTFTVAVELDEEGRAPIGVSVLSLLSSPLDSSGG
jgi:mitotic spindle assembly checkpoint protein MAD2B